MYCKEEGKGRKREWKGRIVLTSANVQPSHLLWGLAENRKVSPARSEACQGTSFFFYPLSPRRRPSGYLGHHVGTVCLRSMRTGKKVTVLVFYLA